MDLAKWMRNKRGKEKGGKGRGGQEGVRTIGEGIREKGKNGKGRGYGLGLCSLN